MYRVIGINGQQYGPVPPEQIRRWLAENRLNAQSLAQLEGHQEWKPLAAWPEFASELKAAPPPISAAAPLYTVPDPVIAARAANKIPAGICGILLGGFGIHKFILGYTAPGLILLLATILTCGILWPITHILGLIEGIIYLTKSDEEFVRIYVDGRREWF